MLCKKLAQLAVTEMQSPRRFSCEDAMMRGSDEGQAKILRWPGTGSIRIRVARRNEERIQERRHGERISKVPKRDFQRRAGPKLANGADVLNPVQWRCRGTEREGLARDFGPSVVFHGGVDNRKTLRFRTPEDVRQEVADNIRIFRDCKGYIVAPRHNIQPNTPRENILALNQAVRDFGRL